MVKNSTNEIQAGVMNALSNSPQTTVRSRPPRLSPELNEFLHMLDALEGQMMVKEAKSGNGR